MGRIISNGLITESIHGLNINTSLLCNSSNYNSASSRQVDYLIIHYTGNQKDSAKANCNYFHTGSRKASAHLFVDENSIWQSVRLKDTAWSIGCKQGYKTNARNANSISVEMCTSGNYIVSEATQLNAAYVMAYLCKLVGISADQVDNYVLRHYDAVKSNKSCPAQFISDPGQFARFKTWIKNILNTGSHMPASSPASTASPVLYRVRKSWADAKSQIGAYNHLEYAKEACKEGYSVYDNNGNAVYSNGHAATPAPQPAPTPKPTQTTYPRKQFVRDIQRAIGAKVDGIPGRETISKTPTLSKSVNRRHPAVIYVQRYLNSIGYNCGDADGITGKKFDAAVKKYQTWMHHPDGEITAGGKTWKHLLGML